MKDEGFLADLYGVTCVCPALISHDPIGALSENVYKLSLPFVTPLRTDDHNGACLRIEQTWLRGLDEMKNAPRSRGVGSIYPPRVKCQSS
jgi:hypothetical protein